MSAMRISPYTITAAIDFGTTCTGYAYSIQRTNNAAMAHVNHDQRWAGDASLGLQAPTTVLMDQNGSFESFGFEAENSYEVLALENKHTDYFYFKHFKMKLHYEKDISRDVLLHDIHGREMKAMKVFTAAIRYVKDHLIIKINENPSLVDNPKADDIKWVLTVPAIWRDSAKQFMREAAKNAGIARNNLVLSLEPEAAAIYCKQQAQSESGGERLKAFDIGKEYILLDLGGGTADTTIHRVVENGTLKELYAATGGPFGGEKVNEAFQKFIVDIVTPKVFKKFRDEKEAQWIKLQSNFEIEKRKFTPNTVKCMISIPRGLSDIYEEVHGRDALENKLTEHKLYGKNKEFTYLPETIVLNKKGMMSMFAVAIDEINAHIRILLSQKHDVSSILLVGGFAESSIVRDSVKSHFEKRLRISSPSSSSSAILRGAVMFGMDPSIISSRICPYTYGFNMQKRFDREIHPPNRKVVIDGKEFVQNAFDKHLEKDQTTYMNKPIKEHPYRVKLRQRSIVWNVYQSEDTNPIFCDELRCERVGRIRLDISYQFPLEKTSLRVGLICLGTELAASARAICVKNGVGKEHTVRCIVDFLSNDPLLLAGSDDVEPSEED